MGVIIAAFNVLNQPFPVILCHGCKQFFALAEITVKPRVNTVIEIFCFAAKV